MPRGVPLNPKAAAAKRKVTAARKGDAKATGQVHDQPELPLEEDRLNAILAGVPLIVPAPVGTYILHVVQINPHKVEIQIHVCTHFERYPDRLVPKGLVPAGESVIEGAVLHPSGHVSGSPKLPITCENLDQYTASVRQRYTVPEKTDDTPAAPPTPKGRRARAAAVTNLPDREDEDLIG